MALNPEAADAESSSATDANSKDANTEGQVDIQGQGEGESASQSSSDADAKETVVDERAELLKVVNKALKKEDPESEAGEGTSKQSDKSSKSENDNQKPEGDSEPLGDVTEEELKSYKPQTRKRIEGLLDERKRLTEERDALRPAADQMETLQTFMQERQLTPQNVSELLVVGGLAMSADPKDLRAALTRVDQFRDQIRSQLGEILPEDLQKKVDEGLMDAESAKEVALSRVETQRASSKVAKADEQVQTATKQVQTVDETRAAEAVHATISDWQRSKYSSDPDYPQKAALLQKEIKLRVMEAGGKVLDKAKALEIAEAAYKEVNTVFKSLTPPNKQPKRVLQSKAYSGNMASKPNSELEAAMAGLERARGG